MKITVKQYQEIYTLPTGLTNTQYTEKVLKIFNIDGNKYTIKEIQSKIDNIKIPEAKKISNFKVVINGKKYGVVKDIMKSTFNEWIQYESIMGVSENDANVVRNLHKILAIYVRPLKRRFLMFNKIQALNKIDIQKNEQMMLDMNIEDALAINIFFYQHATYFIQRIKKHYLNQRILKSQVNYTKMTLIESIKRWVGIF